MADPITSYVAVRSPGDEDEIDIGRYVRFLLRGWWLLALGALAGGAAGFVVATSVPLRYESVATLRITPPRFGPPIVANAPAVLAVIQNRGVAAAVVQELGLGNPPDSLSPQSFIDSALTVDTIPNTNYLLLRVRLLNAELARQAADKTADRTVAEARALGKEETLAFNKQLEDQMTAAATRLRTSESALFAFQKSAQIESLESEVKTVLKQRASLTTVEAERARLRQAEEELAKTPRTVAVAGGDDGSRSSAAGAAASRQVLNPAYDKLEEEIAEIRSSLAGLARTREQLGAAPPSAVLNQLYARREELARLETEHDLAMRFYTDRAAAFETARVQADSAGEELRVMQRATLPSTPLSRRPAMLVGLGLVVGFVLAAMAVLLRSELAERRATA